MQRQLPKNVRQIGNVSDNPKIYVEDYVDTFLGQMGERDEEIIAAALIGEIIHEEEPCRIHKTICAFLFLFFFSFPYNAAKILCSSILNSFTGSNSKVPPSRYAGIKKNILKKGS